MWMNKVVLGLIIVLVSAAGLLAACSGVEPTQALPEERQPTARPTATSQGEQPTALLTATSQEEQPTTPPTEPARPSSAWQADGVVVDGEYAHEAIIGEVRLWWRNDAEFLYLAMEAPTTGWIAVGLDPTNRMEGANFIFGAVADGEVQIWDAYGTAPVGANHPPDEDLGGTNDIVTYTGVEEDGVTRFEVRIPLDSGDEYDKPLQPGSTYPVIAAVGTSDSFDARHSSRAQGEITLD